MKRILLVTLVLITLVSCKKNPSDLQIKYSRVSGLCLGYCDDFMMINQTSISLSRPSNRQGQETINCARNLTEREWTKLNTTISINAFRRLKEDQRANRVADLGEIWIEITTGEVTKKVIFDSNNVSPSLIPLVAELEKIKASLNCDQ